MTHRTPDTPPDFPDGIALVIGGSGGVGAAIAHKLAEAGTAVALTYRRNRAKAETAADAIRRAGHAVEIHPLDTGDAAGVAALTEALVARHGTVHTVVLAAGADIPQKRIHALDLETWRAVIDADVNGAFNIVHGTLPQLRSTGGAYVFISSAGLLRWPDGDVLSVAPKAAIEQLMRGIAREEGRHGVRANSVLLGVIDTGIFHRLRAEADTFFDARWEQAVLRNLAIKRFGRPEEVAATAVFLASSRAGYITGQMIAVDGGYSV